MEVFHCVLEKLLVYPLFKNGNKNISEHIGFTSFWLLYFVKYTRRRVPEHRLATGGFREINNSNEQFDVYEIHKETIECVCVVLCFCWTVRQEKCISAKALYLYFQNKKRKGYVYATQKICKSVRNQHQQKSGSLVSMTSFSEKLSSSVNESANKGDNHNSSSGENKTFPDYPITQKCKGRCIRPLWSTSWRQWHKASQCWEC